jgi:hypothetical protein
MEAQSGSADISGTGLSGLRRAERNAGKAIPPQQSSEPLSDSLSDRCREPSWRGEQEVMFGHLKTRKGKAPLLVPLLRSRLLFGLGVPRRLDPGPGWKE